MDLQLKKEPMWCFDICVTCLSRDRTLVPVAPHLREYALFVGAGLHLYSEVVMCWECVAVLCKVRALRERATRAQQWLSCVQRTQHTEIPFKESLSSLKSSLIKTTYDVKLCHKETHQGDYERYLKSDINLRKSFQNNLNVAHGFNESDGFDNNINLNENCAFVEKEDKDLNKKGAVAFNEKVDIEIKVEQLCEDNHDVVQAIDEYSEVDEKYDFKEKCAFVEKHDEDFHKTGYDAFYDNDDIDEKDEIDIKSDCFAKIDPVRKIAKTKKQFRPKLKFKTVTVSEKKLKAMDIFRKVLVSEEEMKGMRESDRQQSAFAKSKHRCESCIMKFPSQKKLERHNQRLHSKQAGRYTCDICCARYRYLNSLRKHVSCHYARYECRSCAHTSRTESIICGHYMYAHRRGKEFLCDECNMTFRTRMELTRHGDLHRKFICDTCGRRCHSRRTMAKHISSRHLSNTCGLCGVVVRRMKDHMLYVHGRHRPRPEHYCVECGKQYRHKRAFINHLNSVHCAHKKKYPCAQCEKVFSKQCYLTNHINCIHLKKKLHQCNICNKDFVRAYGLRTHMKEVHEGIKTKTKVCNICGRAFHTMKILTNHIRTHTGERPFACVLCPSAFRQLSALKSHCKNVHKLTGTMPVTKQDGTKTDMQDASHT